MVIKPKKTVWALSTQLFTSSHGVEAMEKPLNY